MAGEGGAPLVLHISGDYPDAVQPRKTRAIAALVQGTADRLRHRVYSLNRTQGAAAWLRPGSVERVYDDGLVASWRYAAPRAGMMLASAMDTVADAIVDDVRRRGSSPRIVHGHKLSIEGLAAHRVAKRLGVPYALTLQGNTDQKVIGVRRDLRGRYRRIWHEAAAVFTFAPWIARWCDSVLGLRTGPTVALPCIPTSDTILAPDYTAKRIGTAFHLADWRNKNVAGLALACARIRAHHPFTTLEIAGGGSAEHECAVDQALARANAQRFAQRVGPLAEGNVQPWMNGSAVFALPSMRESFGMVFIEALLAGCPIVYPRGAAVDGFFDGAPFALAVDARDPGDIARGLAAVLDDTLARKRALADWQASGSAAPFHREVILATYAKALAPMTG